MLPIDPVAAPAAACFALGLLAVGYWVYLDASARGSDAPLEWGSSCAVMAPLLPVYLAYRGRIGQHPGTGHRQRAAGTVAFATVVALALTPVLTPPDPFTQIRTFLPLFVVCVAAGYALVYRRGLDRLRRAIGGRDRTDRSR